MKRILHRPSQGNIYVDLPLFRWAEKTQAHPLSYPAQWVRGRCQISPQRARLVAELAGFRMGVQP